MNTATNKTINAKSKTAKKARKRLPCQLTWREVKKELPVLANLSAQDRQAIVDNLNRAGHSPDPRDLFSLACFLSWALRVCDTTGEIAFAAALIHSSLHRDCRA